MADTAVNITAGSGTAIDTRTEGTNGNHRQVIVIGDPATNAGVAPVDATKGLAVDLTATGQNTTALKVDGSAVTQPVSVAVIPSHAVTNAGTFAVQDSEKIADNGAFTDGTTKLMPAGFIFDEVAGTALTENDIAAPRIDAKRAGVTVLEDATTRGQRASISAGGALKVDGSGATQPVSGTVAATIAAGATSIGKAEDTASVDADVGVGALAVRKATPANTSGTDGDYEFLQMSAGRLWASSDISIAGTAVDGNSGNKSAATVRVVLATDQPALTNKLLVTPDSVALPANQSVNVSQINAVTPLMGNGVTGTGSQRVTVASDNTPFAVKVDQTTPGTTNAVSLAQINAATTLAGNGVTGTGAQRVTVASDNTAVANWGQGATGSAVPSGAQYKGGLAQTANPSAATPGNLVGALHDKLGKQVVVGSIRDLKLNQITTISASTAETTVVTAVASTFLDVYGCIVVNSSATAANVSFKDSTAGTTRFNIYVPAGETRGFMLPESGAFAQTTVNNNWTATSSASVSSLIITMLSVKNI